MEFNKQYPTKQGNKLAIMGACTILLFVASFFTAFTNEPTEVKEPPVKQAKIHNNGNVNQGKKIQATGIKINGKVEVVLANKVNAQKVLQQFGKVVVDKTQPGTKVQVKYDEKVELIPVESNEGDVSSVEEAVSVLKKGRTKQLTYTVQKGDNLWTIARKNNIHVKEIREANPGLNTDFIDMGQVINLVKPEPLIHIVATVEYTIKEDIPFTVKIEQDKSLRSGVEKIKQPGEKGVKEVTHRAVMRNGVPIKKEILSQKIIVKPVIKVIARGTKGESRMVASRGESRTDELFWPVRGAITSRYGERWGRNHTGIDIDGTTGDPVKATESGKVIYAGWDSAYGKTIVIDHDSGITTRYAHLSSIGVKSGDKVGRGEYIGEVGTTGRTTGSNLHFEVMSNGAFRNPEGYLR